MPNINLCQIYKYTYIPTINGPRTAVDFIFKWMQQPPKL